MKFATKQYFYKEKVSLLKFLTTIQFVEFRSEHGSHI